MENKFEVGTKVLIKSWSGKYYDECTVDKITPTGLIKVRGSLYKPVSETRAVERGQCPRTIEISTAEKLREIREREYKREYIRSVFVKLREVRSLTYSQAKSLAEVLNFDI